MKKRKYGKKDKFPKPSALVTQLENDILKKNKL
jgi:hypothetical protein